MCFRYSKTILSVKRVNSASSSSGSQPDKCSIFNRCRSKDEDCLLGCVQDFPHVPVSGLKGSELLESPRAETDVMEAEEAFVFAEKQIIILCFDNNRSGVKASSRLYYPGWTGDGA